ncbi:MAG TPA: M56 family metallopeptidase [Solirubrobacteraceae bacterium]|jgi:Zn-dependent protease with chaperone function|nr:M56 family metallopeptidase [Solirubrobacteraceae bacterium]
MSVLLGMLGFASGAFVITRLFASWHITARPAAHGLVLFGQKLSYPAANAPAIIVTMLAGIGLLMAVVAVWGVVRELRADRSFRRAVAGRAPRPFHGAWVIDGARPEAFCAGLLNPRVYLSTGAVELLEAPALAAVLAHERHHAHRRDPLRLACGHVLAQSLFFVPALRRLVQRQSALSELSADEASVLSTGGDASALASAMLSFSQATSEQALGVDPERVDFLLGVRSHWSFPVSLCIAAAAALSLFVGLAVLAGRAATGSATLAAPFLSSQPCVAVLAMLPASAGIAGLAYLRTRRGRA